MAEHRSVDLQQQIGSDLNLIIRPYTEDAGVIGRMVDLAQCQSISHDGLAARFTVRDDMGGIKQGSVSQ